MGLFQGMISVESEASSIEISELLEDLTLSCSWLLNKKTQKWDLDVLMEEEALPSVSLALSLNNLSFSKVSSVEDLDWLEENQKSFPPMEIANFYIYGSHIKDPMPMSRIPLLIDAATAFGSGNHGSTKGCLLALSDLKDNYSFKNIIDVGCGSGILAMGASKLWEDARVFASDIDPECVRVTSENCKINAINTIGVIEAAGVSDLKIKNNAPYGLIIANILANVLCDLQPDLTNILASSGFLVLSGILITQKEKVLERYESFSLYAEYPIDEWVTLVLKPR